jgi:hypothetical protein
MRYICVRCMLFLHIFIYYFIRVMRVMGWACKEELTLRRGCFDFDPAAVSPCVRVSVQKCAARDLMGESDGLTDPGGNLVCLQVGHVQETVSQR